MRVFILFQLILYPMISGAEIYLYKYVKYSNERAFTIYYDAQEIFNIYDIIGFFYDRVFIDMVIKGKPLEEIEEDFFDISTDARISGVPKLVVQFWDCEKRNKLIFPWYYLFDWNGDKERFLENCRNIRRIIHTILQDLQRLALNHSSIQNHTINLWFKEEFYHDEIRSVTIEIARTKRSIRKMRHMEENLNSLNGSSKRENREKFLNELKGYILNYHGNNLSEFLQSLKEHLKSKNSYTEAVDIIFSRMEKTNNYTKQQVIELINNILKNKEIPVTRLLVEFIKREKSRLIVKKNSLINDRENIRNEFELIDQEFEDNEKKLFKLWLRFFNEGYLKKEELTSSDKNMILTMSPFGFTFSINELGYKLR